jgi:16S rRNA pseudouridine516 synthase
VGEYKKDEYKEKTGIDDFSHEGLSLSALSDYFSCITVYDVGGGSMMRLDRFLTEVGCGSRSQVKDGIRKGSVQVNGKIAKKGELKIDEESDCVLFRGKVCEYHRFWYFMMHKPAGVVTAVRDAKERTVMDCFAQSCKDGGFLRQIPGDLAPVGRLDKDTEGLLLLTNNGALAHRMLSPTKHVEKTYFVRAKGSLTVADINSLCQGVSIGDEKPTLPAKVQILHTTTDDAVEDTAGDTATDTADDTVEDTADDTTDDTTDDTADDTTDDTADDTASTVELLLTICEGRFHQVKRMLAAVGCEVVYLKRLRFGSLELDEDLAPGAFRPLTEEEIHDCFGQL